MTNTITAKNATARFLYQTVLGIASGFSLGWFAWVIVDRRIEPIPPLWPFAAAGTILGVAFVRIAARTPRGRTWIHALWIPVAAVVLLMTAIVVALNRWGD